MNNLSLWSDDFFLVVAADAAEASRVWCEHMKTTPDHHGQWHRVRALSLPPEIQAAVEDQTKARYVAQIDE